MENLKVKIVTGENYDLIEDYTSDYFNNKNNSFVKLEFPEEKRHPKEIAELLNKSINICLEDKYINELYITTLSNSVVEYFGNILDKSYNDKVILDNNNVELLILFDDLTKIACKYDNEGCLDKNYPIGFFNIN